MKFAVSGRRGPDPVEWPNGVSDEAPKKAATTGEVDMLGDFPLPSSTGKMRQMKVYNSTKNKGIVANEGLVRDPYSLKNAFQNPFCGVTEILGRGTTQLILFSA